MAKQQKTRVKAGGVRLSSFRRAFGGAALALAITGCSTNPYTGETQLAAYDDSQLSEMSAQAWTELKSQTPTVKSGAQYNRVMSVWRKIAAASPKAGENWDVTVFQSDEVNAFVMPGNRVGVYTGLLDIVENDAQLAAVLGHEVAHAILRHANQRATRAGIASTAAQLGTAVLTNTSSTAAQYGNQLGALGGAAAQLGVVLPYSRSAELEADLAGVDYMHRAGYDPRAAIRLWDVMAAAGGQRTAEFLSTHPNPQRRQAEIRDYIQRKGY